MPFENERAGYAALRRITQSESVRRLQERFKVVKPGEATTTLGQPGIGVEGDIESNQPELILAIDGSNLAVEVETGYPGAEIGYITVAAVLILLEKLRSIAMSEIIDPVEHRRTQKRSSIDTALPGRGVIIDQEMSPQASMRRTLFDATYAFRGSQQLPCIRRQ